jgi:hypothetical protein
MPSNPSYMLLEVEVEEGLVVEEDEVELLIIEIAKLIQNLRRKLIRILLV